MAPFSEGYCFHNANLGVSDAPSAQCVGGVLLRVALKRDHHFPRFIVRS
jgi:hypothetical protein